MIIANKFLIERITAKRQYESGAFHDEAAAIINQAVVSATDGKVPCYAIPGKRSGFKWVSVGSSAVVSRGVAKEWLSRYGVDIDKVEAV